LPKPVEQQKFNDKSIVSIDLDGTITASKSHGPDDFAPLRPGTRDALQKLHKEGFELVIHTARTDHSKVKDYLRKNGISRWISDVSNVKNPSSAIFVDDRALRFEGNWDSTLRKIRKLYRAGFENKDSETVVDTKEDKKLSA
jgi:hypothetical protein